MIPSIIYIVLYFYSQIVCFLCCHLPFPTELIHDVAINANEPKDRAELLIETIVSNLDVDCRGQMQKEIIEISSDHDLEHLLRKSNILQFQLFLLIFSFLLSDRNETRPIYIFFVFEKSDETGRMIAVVAILSCRRLESLIERLQTASHQLNVLLLDFFLCKPGQTLGVYRLEAFRVEVQPMLTWCWRFRPINFFLNCKQFYSMQT